MEEVTFKKQPALLDFPAFETPGPWDSPSLLAGGVVCEAENALALCKHCSPIAVSTLLSSQIQNIAPYQLL